MQTTVSLGLFAAVELQLRRHGGGQEVLTNTHIELLASAGTYLVLNVFYISPLKTILDIVIAINP